VAPWENAENFCFAAADLVARNSLTCSPATAPAADLVYRKAISALGGCASIQAAVDAGRITFDSGAARSCLEALDTGGCFAADDFCDAALRGAVPDAGSCRSTYECASPYSRCATEATCPGLCTRRSDNTPCDSSADCDPATLYCNLYGTPSTCQLRVGPGLPCSYGPVNPCVDGYGCGPAGTCIVQPSSPGEPCTPGSGCSVAAGLACDGTTGTCAPAPNGPSPVGGPCGGGFYCDDRTAFCGPGYQCVARFPRDQGFGCTSDDQCASPGHCSLAAGDTSYKCRSFQPVGGPCAGGHGDCVVGAYCDAALDAPGVCRAQPVLGERCNISGPIDPSFCLDGWCNTTATPGSETCVPYLGAGAQCSLPGSAPCDPIASLVCDGTTHLCTQSACY
jgi:hypothetical protein